MVLAKEAGLCYASIAMATDYDSWRDGDDAVSVTLIFNMNCIYVQYMAEWSIRELV